ncbi:hypothetical protein RND71_026627 [Anisodus tanguticus]|uniref:Phytocyanin domain-containing protein n=1 Tax=Anisodus tanguticus TaxID=243964 RepID=A0AAE1RMJ7_9SOLA|nr:hypothetical protein RND71_026627 [Anisodus tanguticus]
MVALSHLRHRATTPDEVFKFTTNRHDVQEVSESSFEECTTDNTIGESIMTGPANVSLESPGDNYYICTMDKHCEAGHNRTPDESIPIK